MRDLLTPRVRNRYRTHRDGARGHGLPHQLRHGTSRWADRGHKALTQVNSGLRSSPRGKSIETTPPRTLKSGCLVHVQSFNATTGRFTPGTSTPRLRPRKVDKITPRLLPYTAKGRATAAMARRGLFPAKEKWPPGSGLCGVSEQQALREGRYTDWRCSIYI